MKRRAGGFEVCIPCRACYQHTGFLERLPDGCDDEPEPELWVCLGQAHSELFGRRIDPGQPVCIGVVWIDLAAWEHVRASHEAAPLMPAEHEGLEAGPRFAQEDHGCGVFDRLGRRLPAHDSRETNT